LIYLVFHTDAICEAYITLAVRYVGNVANKPSCSIYCATVALHPLYGLSLIYKGSVLQQSQMEIQLLRSLNLIIRFDPLISCSTESEID